MHARNSIHCQSLNNEELWKWLSCHARGPDHKVVTNSRRRNRVSTGGSVVQFSPARWEARVRFPSRATFFHFTHFYIILCDLKYFINRCFSRVALVVQW